MTTETILRKRVLAKFPGSRCQKEGALYVVRTAEGRLLTARATRGGAWGAAGRGVQ